MLRLRNGTRYYSSRTHVAPVKSAYIRFRTPIQHPAHLFATVRAIEERFGTVREFSFKRDFEVTSTYQILGFATFVDQDSFFRVPKQAQVIKVRVNGMNASFGADTSFSDILPLMSVSEWQQENSEDVEVTEYSVGENGENSHSVVFTIEAGEVAFSAPGVEDGIKHPPAVFHSSAKAFLGWAGFAPLHELEEPDEGTRPDSQKHMRKALATAQIVYERQQAFIDRRINTRREMFAAVPQVPEPAAQHTEPLVVKDSLDTELIAQHTEQLVVKDTEPVAETAIDIEPIALIAKTARTEEAPFSSIAWEPLPTASIQAPLPFPLDKKIPIIHVSSTPASTKKKSQNTEHVLLDIARGVVAKSPNSTPSSPMNGTKSIAAEQPLTAMEEEKPLHETPPDQAKPELTTESIPSASIPAVVPSAVETSPAATLINAKPSAKAKSAVDTATKTVPLPKPQPLISQILAAQIAKNAAATVAVSTPASMGNNTKTTATNTPKPKKPVPQNKTLRPAVVKQNINGKSETKAEKEPEKPFTGRIKKIFGGWI